MAYSTTPYGIGEATKSLANAFTGVGSNGVAKNQYYSARANTEYQRQQLMAQEVLSEAIKQKQMQAEAAKATAEGAKADQETQQLKSKVAALGSMQKMIEDLPNSYSKEATVNAIGQQISQNPIGTEQSNLPTQQDLQDEAFQKFGPMFTGAMIRAGVSPKDINMPAAMLTVPQSPGQTGRDLLATGKTAMQSGLNVPAGNRFTDTSGNEVVPLAPSFVDNQNAQADKNEAQAGYYEKKGAGASNGGKVPKFGVPELEAAMANTGKMLGVKPAMIDYGKGPQASFSMGFMGALQQNPQLGQDLNHIAANLWQSSGGNAAMVEQGLQTYMRGITGPDGKPITDFNSIPAGVKTPDAQKIVDGLTPSAQAVTGGPPALGSAFTAPPAAAPTATAAAVPAPLPDAAHDYNNGGTHGALANALSGLFTGSAPVAPAAPVSAPPAPAAPPVMPAAAPPVAPAINPLTGTPGGAITGALFTGPAPGAAPPAQVASAYPVPMPAAGRGGTGAPVADDVPGKAGLMGTVPAAAPAGQDGPPVVGSAEEAMKLPSGTKFLTPDGRLKVRP